MLSSSLPREILFKPRLVLIFGRINSYIDVNVSISVLLIAIDLPTGQSSSEFLNSIII